ncbi:MAG: ATP-binding protein [Bdellovibrionales bacterium]|nr:ATP-binding protein [Bdellovibrionales bacterium]
MLGPRQCGKSTLAKEYLKTKKDTVYLDLENDQDRFKIKDIWEFFNYHKEKLICLDEIQRLPEIFSQIRSYVDQSSGNGRFLILGSASRDLIKQSSETLAGRISYIEMGPFSYKELQDTQWLNEHFIRGSFPRSVLAKSHEESFDWRKNYIRTFLERDIPNLGFRVPSSVLNNFWHMLAHLQGQILNADKLGTSLGVTAHTVKNYIHILKETFMIRCLPAYFFNTKKRLIKSQKIYIRDTGIVHALLNLDSIDNLLGHPVYGFSYETYVIETLINLYPQHEAYFFKTAKGEEIDLVLIKGQQKIAFEIKASAVPKIEKGFWSALDILKPDEVCIIAKVDKDYPIQNGVMVKSLSSVVSSTKV